MNSTHAAFVVPIKLENHPNADSLSIVRFEGFTMIVRTEDWIGVKKGIHIQPDSIVDTTRPEFSFLADPKRPSKTKFKVKVKKMRGIISYGVLIPLEEGVAGEIGEDFAERLGVEHYEPPLQFKTNTNNVSAPPGYFTKYDIDNIRKYNKIFKEGELVNCTEKIHGAFFRCVFSSKKDCMYVGNRTQWKADEDLCLWWKAFRKYPQIEQFCRDYPDWILNGEMYGQVQNLKYGKTGVDFAAFDIRRPDSSWCIPENFIIMCHLRDIPTVPVLANMFSFNFEKILEMSNGPSLIEDADHYREGCVIKPMVERTDDKIGRVILKCVGEDYLSGKNSSNKNKETKGFKNEN